MSRRASARAPIRTAPLPRPATPPAAVGDAPPPAASLSFLFPAPQRPATAPQRPAPSLAPQDAADTPQRRSSTVTFRLTRLKSGRVLVKVDRQLLGTAHDPAEALAVLSRLEVFAPEVDKRASPTPRPAAPLVMDQQPPRGITHLSDPETVANGPTAKAAPENAVIPCPAQPAGAP